MLDFAFIKGGPSDRANSANNGGVPEIILFVWAARIHGGLVAAVPAKGPLRGV